MDQSTTGGGPRPPPEAGGTAELRAERGWGAAAMRYGTSLTVTAVAFGALWLHASRWGRLLVAHADPGKVRTITARFMPDPPMYLVTTLLAPWSVAASLAVHLLLAVLYLLSERVGGAAPSEGSATGGAPPPRQVESAGEERAARMMP